MTHHVVAGRIQRARDHEKSRFPYVCTYVDHRSWYGKSYQLFIIISKIQSPEASSKESPFWSDHAPEMVGNPSNE